MADSNPAKHRAKSSWFVPAAWVSAAAAAAVIALGVNGTLSSWTAAVLDNNTNTVKTAQALILQETVTGSTGNANADCVSSNNANNISSCTEINKYGGTTTPLTPGTSQSTSVTFTNAGTATSANFGIYPGVTPGSTTVPGTTAACTQTPTSGTAIGTSSATYANLCSSTNADLQLTLACYTGASIPADGTTGKIAALSYSGNIGGFSSALTSAQALAPNGAISCKFTVALATTASPLDGGITVSQPIRWVLS